MATLMAVGGGQLTRAQIEARTGELRQALSGGRGQLAEAQAEVTRLTVAVAQAEGALIENQSWLRIIDEAGHGKGQDTEDPAKPELRDPPEA